MPTLHTNAAFASIQVKTMDIEIAWLVNGHDVPLPVVEEFALPRQRTRVTEMEGGSEIVNAFENEDCVQAAIMDMSELLQSDPCLLIQKLVNAQRVATFYNRDNLASARVSRDMYEDLRSERKQIGNRSLFIYQIPRSSVLNALNEYITEVSEYSQEKLKFAKLQYRFKCSFTSIRQIP